MGQYVSLCEGCGKNLLEARHEWVKQTVLVKWGKGKYWKEVACSRKCAKIIDKNIEKEERYNA